MTSSATKFPVGERTAHGPTALARIEPLVLGASLKPRTDPFPVKIDEHPFRYAAGQCSYVDG